MGAQWRRSSPSARRAGIPEAILVAAVPLLLAVSGPSSASDLARLPPRLPPPVQETDFVDPGPRAEAKVRLGRFLFFDKILSGNRNISCATCHHPLAQTGDGLSLPLGEGARGLAGTRAPGDAKNGVRHRVPRNSPPLFNLGLKRVRVLFHDGRVEADDRAPGGFRTPAGDDLPPGLDGILAAQAMFPVGSADEMAGHADENPLAAMAADERLAGPEGVWARLARRLRAIPAYVELFRAAFPDIDAPADITYVHAANAIGAFQARMFRAVDSPFDRFLRGEADALDARQKRGMALFFGKAGCGGCHSGPLLSDQQFHAIAMPQVGPGKGDGPAGVDDFGRARVTGRAEDRYRFRTPPLRNVALTGPWGHSGAYDSLEAVVRHHLDPMAAFEAYDTDQLRLPSRPDLDAVDRMCLDDADARRALKAANELAPRSLEDAEVAELIAFLHALTDVASLDLRHIVPQRVPSGLPVFD